MNCARCSHPTSRVLQTRREEPDTILRQRICRECGYTWFTLELEMPDKSVRWVKKGGSTGLVRNEGYQHVRFY